MTTDEKQQMRERAALAALTGLLANTKLVKYKPGILDDTYEGIASDAVYVGALFVEGFNKASEMDDDEEEEVTNSKEV